MFQLARYKCTMSNALEVGGDIQGTAGGATDAVAWASIAAGGVNPGENPGREERQPSSSLQHPSVRSFNFEVMVILEGSLLFIVST